MKMEMLLETALVIVLVDCLASQKDACLEKTMAMAMEI